MNSKLYWTAVTLGAGATFGSLIVQGVWGIGQKLGMLIGLYFGWVTP